MMTSPSPPSKKGTLAVQDLVAMLAPTLGREKSDELVRSTASELGLTEPVLDKASALTLIDRLGAGAGLAGVAARFVRARYLRMNVSSIRPAATMATPSTPATQFPPPLRGHVQRDALVQLLAPTLGEEKSAELIEGAARRRGENLDRLDRLTALAILEELAEVPGIVGVAARFAKARALLVLG